jgi:CBS domain-containing protein
MIVEALLHHHHRRVVTVPMDKTLKATVALMRSQNVDAVVIMDFCATEGEAVFGVLTRQDVINAVADHGLEAFAMPVSKLRTSSPVYCDVKQGLSQLVGMMRERSARHAIVMDRDCVAGLIDASDILFSGHSENAAAHGSGMH